MPMPWMPRTVRLLRQCQVGQKKLAPTWQNHHRMICEKIGLLTKPHWSLTQLHQLSPTAAATVNTVVSTEKLKQLAALAHVQIPPEACQATRDQINAIIQCIATLQQAPVVPASSLPDIQTSCETSSTTLRPDTVDPNEDTVTNQLQNAKVMSGHYYFKVPLILEEDTNDIN